MLRSTTVLLLACCAPAPSPDAGPPLVQAAPAADPSTQRSGQPAVVESSEPTTSEPPMQVLDLSNELRVAMTGVTWHEGCPVALSDLVLLRLPYRDHTGAESIGELIVHRDVHIDVGRAFAQLHRGGFSITQMRLAHHFGGDDDVIMAQDNTSAFNCRSITGAKSWSEHSYGRAVDINPLRNPYVKRSRVLPPAGREWLERDAGRPGVIAEDGVVTRAFDAIGWPWGGRWSSSKDYQHFSKSGR